MTQNEAMLKPEQVQKQTVIKPIWQQSTVGWKIDLPRDGLTFVI